MPPDSTKPKQKENVIEPVADLGPEDLESGIKGVVGLPEEGNVPKREESPMNNPEFLRQTSDRPGKMATKIPSEGDNPPEGGRIERR